MNPLAIVGAFIITFSLLAYGIGSISLIRFKIVGSIVLIFLSLGLVFDMAAIALMIVGARETSFTLHGLLGYSAYLVMLVASIGVWRVYFKHGIDSRITKPLLRYTKFAYLWWVIAYFTGSLIILWR
ncbi:hypothetical protein OU798_17750 [Prolixibacteraceae bacterium Z1-6]|uniref:Uncharacterized protein n=1 Tax=Draconibacterium aestuarii TaxID=2998507 RepID=A0A9X3J778_9BACT|nr:hypothetical protein [Prolixibacteraceae bacterium Z1-6]